MNHSLISPRHLDELHRSGKHIELIEAMTLGKMPWNQEHLDQ